MEEEAPFDTNVNYYQVLGLKEANNESYSQISRNKIRKKFQKLRNKNLLKINTLQGHTSDSEIIPDSKDNSEELSKAEDRALLLTQAYNVLSDNSLRLKYDIAMGFANGNKNSLNNNKNTIANSETNNKETIRKKAEISRKQESEITMTVFNKQNGKQKKLNNAGLIIMNGKYGNDKTNKFINVTDALQSLVKYRGNDGSFILIDENIVWF